MKIERISENQLKLTLTKDDLVERDIRPEDLITPSEKTQKLFRDIMEQALDEADFISENTPLMVEAVPSGTDSIMIIVTKVSGKDKSTKIGTDALSQAQDLHRWKKKPIDVQSSPAAEAETSDFLIYSFPELDDVIQVSLRLTENFRGESSLYKNENKYFLILQGGTYTAEASAAKLELILKEYGQKHISTPLAKYYLLEHGEAILSKDAIGSLIKAFG